MQIYKITNLINNKIYIGKDTSSSPDYFGSGLLINRAFIKYGKEKFIKEVIDETTDYQELSNKEIYWISYYKSTDRKIGYNISKGGDGGDVLTNHPDLNLIKQKISKNSPKTGKTYDEAFGEEKSKKYKENLSINNKQPLKGKKYEEYYGKERSLEIKSKISKSSIGKIEDRWGDKDKVDSHREFLKSNIHNSILREDVVINNIKRMIEKWDNFREVYLETLKSLISKIEKDGLDQHLNEINNEISRIPNSVFKKRSEFYDFLGPKISIDISNIFYKIRKSINKEICKNQSKKISIDEIVYNSISEASKLLNIERSLIRYRLKSKNYSSYFYI
jgi:hypothetical protein